MIEPTQMIKQSVLRLKTTVLAEGKVEIVDPQLRPGEAVEVIILLPEAKPAERRSVMDILAEAPGQRLFKTPEEVEAYLREERRAWED